MGGTVGICSDFPSLSAFSKNLHFYEKNVQKPIPELKKTASFSSRQVTLSSNTFIVYDSSSESNSLESALNKQNASPPRSRPNATSPVEDEINFHDAEVTINELVQRYEKCLGENHPETLQVKFMLGKFYSDNRKHDKALAIFEELYKVRVLLNGSESFEALTVKMHRADQMVHFKDRLVEAEEQYLDLLARFQCKKGELDPITLTLMFKLATTYEKQHLFAQAQVWHSSCLQRRITAFGEDHQDTKLSKAALAKLLNRIDNEKSLENAIRPVRKVRAN